MDIAQRALRAKALLEDPLFTEAFDMVEKAQIAVFTEQVCGDEQLMEAHRMVRALRLVKAELVSAVMSGKLLEHRNLKGQHRA